MRKALHAGLLNYLANRKRIFILMYHRVNDYYPPNELTVSVRQFREQMAYIKKHCHAVGVEELYGMIAGKKGIKGRHKPQVVITIDDGYRDMFLNAFPILKELNLPAAVFLSTGFIGTNKKMRRYEHLTSPDMLSWEEVKIMQKNNIFFGAHTVSHPHLSALDYAAQKREIEESIKTVYAQTAAEASKHVFCYTYGEYNEDTLKILKESGVKMALTVKSGVNTSSAAPLELKRIGIHGTRSMNDFVSIFRPN